jgi:hypothetical protein
MGINETHSYSQFNHLDFSKHHKEVLAHPSDFATICRQENIELKRKSEYVETCFKKKKTQSESLQNPNQIDEVFNCLVNICCLLARRTLDPKLVLQVLLKYEGKVVKTMIYFSKN